MDPAQRLREGDLFEDETFVGLELHGADLGDKDLLRCVFRRCKLSETRWAGGTLEDCRFEDCDLTRFDPGDLGVRGVRFGRCKLMGVDWSGVRPHPDVAFDGCDLRYASFVKLALRRTPFLSCVAREANFIDADLAEADFAGTDLAGATIEGCALMGADLSRASGVAVDPARNRVKDARVSTEAALAIARSFGVIVAE